MKIRTLVLAGALAIPGLAFAQGDTMDPAAPRTGSADQKQADQYDTADKAKAQGAMKQQHAKGKKTAAAFENADNYEFEGTVASLNTRGRQITLQREDTALPTASFRIPADAEIMIDGEKGQLQQVRRGADVRATFNLADQQPVVLKLDVTSPEGATPKDTKKDGEPKDTPKPLYE